MGTDAKALFIFILCQHVVRHCPEGLFASLYSTFILLLSLSKSRYSLTKHKANLPQSPGLTLPFQQAQNISLPHDGTSGAGIGVHEFDGDMGDMGDVTGVSGTAEDSVDLC